MQNKKSFNKVRARERSEPLKGIYIPTGSIFGIDKPHPTSLAGFVNPKEATGADHENGKEQANTQVVIHGISTNKEYGKPKMLQRKEKSETLGIIVIPLKPTQLSLRKTRIYTLISLMENEKKWQQEKQSKSWKRMLTSKESENRYNQ
ncbi:hypothetical protein HAX54_000610 [Datura stramonium]|uniref:Uncharacterized protein n=1 Tax=Datura stramonium TaxID=4076 RepID=A0ABS8WSJ2_DATST|nr:hypothetical protein [Datura stramonium]